MSNLDIAFDAASEIDLRSPSWRQRKDQLREFSEAYSFLSEEEAITLRSTFDSKDRLAYFRSAASLFRDEFAEAAVDRKIELLRIFFALYSFDNLEFGYDSVQDVMAVSEEMRGYREVALREWEPFAQITSNDTAKKNLENKLFR